MGAFIPSLPTGQSLVIFFISVIVGSFVIIKFCLEQFDKPPTSSKAPWDFVVPSFLTSRRQYLAGFAIYCCSILLLFLVVSIAIGPANFLFIIKTIEAALAQRDPPNLSSLNGSTLEHFPTFPIIVAFYIVGLNPNLPKALDFELPIRKLGRRIAYIPKNMSSIFDYMRFSQFNASEEDLKDSYSAAELRRPAVNNDELRTIMPALNRAVTLYAKAAALAGDLTLESADQLARQIDLEVFRQYRDEIQQVGISLQGIDSRLLDVADLDVDQRQNAVKAVQRDLRQQLEVLYVIFACASTTRDLGRISDRLRVIGFVSRFAATNPIPWNPILLGILPGALVVALAYLFASAWLPQGTHYSLPTTTGDNIRQLLIVIFVHSFAIGQSILLRTHLIGSDQYYSETGGVNLLAYAKIFIRCWAISSFWYLALYFYNFVSSLPSGPTVILTNYGYTFCLWACVPALCGAVTAYVVDRPANNLIERGISGGLLGLSMGLAAGVVARMIPDWTALITNLNQPGTAAVEEADLRIQLFYFVVYGGLGGAIGFFLPNALHRHWRAVQDQLPEQINLLRGNVAQYFHNMQQFNEWLYAANTDLERHRPLDLLADDGGIARLTDFVSRTRRKVVVP